MTDSPTSKTVAEIVRHIDLLLESGDEVASLNPDEWHRIKGAIGAVETSGELERLRELQEKALALDDAVAEFGIDKPQYIAEVYQAFHDVLHDGHGAMHAVEPACDVCHGSGWIWPPHETDGMACPKGCLPKKASGDLVPDSLRKAQDVYRHGVRASSHGPRCMCEICQDERSGSGNC